MLLNSVGVSCVSTVGAVSKHLLVCLFVVKPVVELTQADEDEFSKNLKQLQTDV